MTFNNDLITETIKIYLGCVGSWAYLYACPPFSHPPWPLAWSALLLSAALSARAPWNFWIILHCLLVRARDGGGQRWGRGRELWVSGGPHVRKKNEYTKKTQNWRPAAKQNERCKKGEGEGATGSQEGLLFFLLTCQARAMTTKSVALAHAHTLPLSDVMCVWPQQLLSPSLSSAGFSYTLCLSMCQLAGNSNWWPIGKFNNFVVGLLLLLLFLN